MNNLYIIFLMYCTCRFQIVNTCIIVQRGLYIKFILLFKNYEKLQCYFHHFENILGTWYCWKIFPFEKNVKVHNLVLFTLTGSSCNVRISNNFWIFYIERNYLHLTTISRAFACVRVCARVCLRMCSCVHVKKLWIFKLTLSVIYLEKEYYIFSIATGSHDSCGNSRN